MPDRAADQLMPDDSYAFPADVLPSHLESIPRSVAAEPDFYAVPNPDEEDVSYSLPLDALPQNGLPIHDYKNYSPGKLEVYNSKFKENDGPTSPSKPPSLERGLGGNVQASRPTHLDLR